MTAVDLMSVIARAEERPALMFADGHALSYAELDSRMQRFADRLGGGKRLVAIAADLSEHVIVAYLGALRAGHAVAMLPPCDERLWDDFRDAFQPDFTYRQVDQRWRLVAENEPDAVGPPLHPDLALLLMTSGTSGAAKAVRLSYANLDSNARAIAAYLKLSPSDRTALVLPLHYSYGLSVLHSHLVAGGSIFLPGMSVMDSAFARAIGENGCTNLSGVPYSYELMEKAGFRSAMPDGLRFMTVAGGRLGPDLIRLYRDHMHASGGQFFVMYGQTEATARIAFIPPDCLSDNEERIGIAIPGGSLDLVDNEGRRVVDAGVTGELVYRGPNVMMGYGERRADLARGAEVHELRTGDVGMRCEDGLFRIVGRKARFAKIAGLRIGFDIMEQALARHDIAAAVLGDDARLQVYVDDAALAEKARHILVEASRLPANLISVSVRQNLPRLGSGKIDYARLAEEMLETRSRRQSEAHSLIEAFAAVFYPVPVGRNDSFVSLGGDSLRFLQLTLELDRLGLVLPEGWERMRLAELGARPEISRPPARGEAVSVPSDLMLRAIAIMMVVIHHQMLWPIPGGSGVMMLLVGFSLARFQSDHLLAGRFHHMLRSAGNVLIPYFLIVAAYAFVWRTMPWASLTLTGNFGYAEPERHEMIPYLYWFIEAYAQTLLVFSLIFAIPFVRSFAVKRLFAFSLALLGLAIAARFSMPLLVGEGKRQIFTLYWVFHICVFGWCAGLADTRAKRLAVAAMAIAMLGYLGFGESLWIGTTMKYMSILAALLVLLYKPHLRLPAALSRFVTVIAASAFPIYLLHRFVPELLMTPAFDGLASPAFDFVAIAGGVAVGVSANRAISRLGSLSWILTARRWLAA
ncbi:AMP-dependent synthetase [Rhizobium sp. R339]|nr:AMP-dependent synthetase [Rhizobium sp. R339]